MNSFSAKNRTAILRQLSQESFDVVVIGGGITGSGIALDAAARGLKVALIEMQDFAAGTSGRSTKLIHGGLRYLKQLEFRLVSEVGKEREIIHRIAPHLTRPEPMLLPITRKGAFGKFTTRLAMKIYEFLAGVTKEERHRSLSADETLQLEPLLKKEGLLGGILYYEYRTDDARLTISVLKEAVNRGALAVSYLKVTGFTYEQGKISGVKAEDKLHKGSYTIKADHVINAAGPWVDELDSLDDETQGHKLQLTKGVHLVTAHRRLPVKQSVYFDTYDGRMVFVIPREGKTYIGTTDTFYSGDKQNPLISVEDKTYLLQCVNACFSGQPLQLSDIESGWAGIRPLIRKPGKKPSEISRKDEIFTWKSGLITIAGGKLTGYRKMAQQVVDLLAQKIAVTQKRHVPACSTHQIILSGGDTASIKDILPACTGMNAEEKETFFCRYGSEIKELCLIMNALREKEGAEHPLPLSWRAELIYSIEHEMCLSPADFFIRRTGMLYFDIGSVKKYRIALIAYMRETLRWDDALTEKYDKELQEAVPV